MQFITLCFTVLTEIYLYAWPADYINDMVNEIPLYAIIELHHFQIQSCINS